MEIEVNKLWWRIPIILFCLLMVATTVLFAKVAYAASGMPEFGLLLNAGLDGFKAYLNWLLEILKVILQ